MDVLSQLIAGMRTDRPQAFVIEGRAPWGREYPPVPGAGFHVLLEGSVVLSLSGGRSVRLSVGDVVVLPTGTGHGMASAAGVPLVAFAHEAEPSLDGAPVVLGPDGEAQAESTTRMLCGTYVYDNERVHPLMHRLPEVIHLPARLGAHGELGTATRLLAAEIAASREGRDLALTSLLDLLLVQIFRAWFAEHPEHGWAAAFHDPTVTTALQLIHQRPDEPWTVDTLGAEAGLSRAAFSRRFTALVGLPPMSYLTWWRMTVAARALHDEEVGLAEIARRVGYASPYAFANAFKRTHGVSPGRYRSRTRDPHHSGGVPPLRTADGGLLPRGHAQR